MSSVSFRCPSCDAALRGLASLKTEARVRCNKCGAVFGYGAATGASTAPASIALERKPRPRSRPPEEEEEDEAPARPAKGDGRQDRPARKKKQKAGNTGLIVGVALGGGAGLIAVAIVVVLWVMSGPKTVPATGTVPVALTTPPPAGTGPAPLPPVQVVNPAPPVAPAVGNGGLAVEVLDRVKKATVYIRVNSAAGAASGSGFVEASSGQVLTNAHVLGMLNLNEPPPLSIEVVLQSGSKGEKSLPARIVTVDRSSDLAVLSVDFQAAGLAGPPASLAVASAEGLRETQQVYVFGFPFGEGLGKDITVSTSSVSSLRKDKDGFLAQVQVNGGMNPGNSGGPVVDAAGNVVGVAVSGIRNTQINFAIPGDAVRTVFNGRCSELRVGEAFHKGGQIAVPVDVSVIDPMQRIAKFSIEWWTGDPDQVVPPAEASPGGDRQTTPVALQPAAATGHAELVLPAVPAPGKVLWVQPVFVNGDGRQHWAAGLKVVFDPPIDPKPVALSLRPQPGKLRLGLKSTATMQVRSLDGEKHSLYRNLDTQLIEDTRQVDARGVATLALGVDKFAVGLSIDGNGAPSSPRFYRAVQDVGKLGMALTVDVQGNVTQKGTDLAAAPEASRAALEGMGDQLLTSFDIASVPVPGGMLQPGQTWKASRAVPVDAVDSYLTIAADMTYTYRGVRMVDGRELAVIDLNGVVNSGKVKISNATGTVRGTAVVDPAAGRVIEVHLVADVTLDIPFRGESLTSNGKLEVRLTRRPMQL